MNKILKVFIIGVVSVALPMAQAYAVLPHADSVFENEVAGNFTEEIQISGLVLNSATPQGEISDIPYGELINAETVIPLEDLTQGIALEEIEATSEEELLTIPGEEHHFWTTRKMVVTTSILLTTGLLVGLLLFLAAGAGGGSGGSSSAGGGGGTILGPLGGPPGPNGTDGPNDLVPEGPGGPEDFVVPTGIIPPVVGGDPGVDPEAILEFNPGSPNGIPGTTTIPHHPEPSTFLLMALGLLIPFFRKKTA